MTDTITIPRATVQQLLEALLLPSMKTQQMLIQRDEAIIALRRALEQQQAEPVAWINPHDLAALKRGEEGVYLVYEVEVGGGAPLWDACLPQQQAEPVILNGLTDAETNATASVMGLTKQAEPVCPDCKAAVLYECVACSSNNYPPQRQWVGLTDKEIQAIHDTYYRRMGPMEFARSIEAKLKERNT